MKPPTSLSLGTPQGGRPPAARQSRFRGGKLDPAIALEDLPLQCTRLTNGVELHHASAGEGPPLIFVHGAMGDWRSSAPQWAAFVPHFRCISYSRRYSHPNGNDMPSPDHSALQEAEDLRLFMDALGLRSAHFVASSYGAFTVLALAVRGLQGPQRVAALVAVEPAMLCYADFSDTGRRARALFREHTIEPANAAFRRGEDAQAAALMTGGIMGAALPVLDDAAMARRLQNVKAMRMLALSSNEFPLLPPAALGALGMPVLLVRGAQTAPIHVEVFRNVCAAMPQAATLEVPGAGHSVARDQPAVFNAQALDFLRRQAVTA